MAPLIEVSAETAQRLSQVSSDAVARELHELSAGVGPGESYLDIAALRTRDDLSTILRRLALRLSQVPAGTRLVFRMGDFSAPQRFADAQTILRRNGAAIRVSRADYVNAQLASVRSFLQGLSLTPHAIDLIVDCKVVEDGQTMVGTATLLESRIPWQSVAYVGGSFPQNLADLAKNDQHELPRREWQRFTEESLQQGRPVRFGDYTVQHPFQQDPPPKVLPSGSIRYTSDQHWVVMRGEKLDAPDSPGHEQYIALAQLLCERPEFRGSEFSAGDRYIALMAGQTQNTGSPMTWLQAGINHHLTFAARQLEAFAAA